jgi:hypothetical protein
MKATRSSKAISENLKLFVLYDVLVVLNGNDIFRPKIVMIRKIPAIKRNVLIAMRIGILFLSIGRPKGNQLS